MGGRFKIIKNVNEMKILFYKSIILVCFSFNCLAQSHSINSKSIGKSYIADFKVTTKKLTMTGSNPKRSGIFY